MNKKRLLALVVAASAGLAASQAQTPAPATTVASTPSITGKIAAAVVTNYMFRGQRLGGWALQPNVELTSGNLTGGVWANFPFKDKVPDTSDPEIDVYGAYNFTVTPALSLAPGFTWYWYPDAPEALGFYRSTFEPNVGLTYSIDALKLTPKVYYDFVLDGPTYELTAAYAAPLKELGTELDFTGVIGTYYLRDATNDASPAVKAWGDYWLVGVSAPFTLAKGSTLTLGYAYTKGDNAYGKQGTTPKFPNALAVGRSVLTVSYTYNF